MVAVPMQPAACSSSYAAKEAGPCTLVSSEVTHCIRTGFISATTLPQHTACSGTPHSMQWPVTVEARKAPETPPPHPPQGLPTCPTASGAQSLLTARRTACTPAPPYTARQLPQAPLPFLPAPVAGHLRRGIRAQAADTTAVLPSPRRSQPASTPPLPAAAPGGI